MEKFIIAGGCALRISDTGNGKKTVSETGSVADTAQDKPVLLLLHGYLESLDVWDSFTPLLTPHFRVVAIDLPGHGISEVKGDVHTMEFLADVTAASLDVLEIEKCIVAGHSMGGYAALEMLRKYTAKLDGLILFHSTPDPDTDAKKDQRQREIEVVLSGKKDLLAMTVDKGFAVDNRRRFADEIEELREQVILTEEEGIVALLHGMIQRRDNNETMRGSNVPQMMLFGCKDEYIVPDAASEIIANQPQAGVVWLEDSGHMGFIEQPDKAAVAILEFAGKGKVPRNESDR